MNVLVLWEYSSVAALHVLLLLCESFKAIVFLVYIFDLPSNYIHALIVVLVDRGYFVWTILHRSKFIHCCRLVLDGGLTQCETTLHEVITVIKRSRTLKTKTNTECGLTLWGFLYTCL
jgi:hypothetical protein